MKKKDSIPVSSNLPVAALCVVPPADLRQIIDDTW